MNSLSITVGGEVINEDDINISSLSSRQRTKKPPLMLRGNTTGGASHHRAVRRNQMKSIDTKNNDISPRGARSNMPRASLNRHRSAPVSDNNTSSNFGSSSRIMRRNRGLSISERSNTEESVDDVNSRLRTSLLQSMSNLSSRSTATPPFDNRNYTTSTVAAVDNNKDDEAAIGEQFDEVYKSTSDEDTNNNSIANNTPRVVTPRSSSPHNNSNNKQSILSQLNTISKLEPYNSSPYFQKIFTNGKLKVQNYYTRQENTEELHTIEHALRKCFDINEDMISVIANSTVTSGDNDDVQKKERIMMDEYLSEKLFDGDSLDSPEQDTQKKLKPWETPTISTPRSLGRGGLSTTPRRLDRNSGRYQSQFTTPTDLSGYRNKKMSAASYVPLQDTPKHALTLPLPPTPRTPGKHTPTSPEDNEHVAIVVPNDKKLYLPSPSEASSSSTPSPASTTNVDDHKKVTTKYLVDTSLKSIPRNRQQQSRVRIQEYLVKVDDRIKSVKSAVTVGRWYY